MQRYSELLRNEANSNRKIFWDVSSIDNLSDSAIVERILSYGDMEQFKDITKDTVSFKKVYYEIKSKKRNNLSPMVINYVDLYLKNNA